MELYKKVIMSNLRIKTDSGRLTPVQVAQLPIESLDAIAVQLQNKVQKRQSFLRSASNTEDKLAFDFVYDVLLSKIAEKDDKKEVTKLRKEKELLMEMLQKKQIEKVENLSEEDIHKKLESLTV